MWNCLLHQELSSHCSIPSSSSLSIPIMWHVVSNLWCALSVSCPPMNHIYLWNGVLLFWQPLHNHHARCSQLCKVSCMKCHNLTRLLPPSNFCMGWCTLQTIVNDKPWFSITLWTCIISTTIFIWYLLWMFTLRNLLLVWGYLRLTLIRKIVVYVTIALYLMTHSCILCSLIILRVKNFKVEWLFL